MGTEIDVLGISISAGDVTLSAQQQGSLLRKHVRTDFKSQGKEIFFDFVGEFPMVPKTSRHMIVPISDPPFSRRRITTNTKVGSSMVDRDDLIKAASDPSSAIVEAAGYAAGREWDYAILVCLGGNAYSISETGADTAVPLPTTMKLPTADDLSGGTGFTWNKLKAIPGKFLAQKVDIRREDICLVIDPYQNGELIDLTEVKNGLYKGLMNATIVNGLLTSVLGMSVEVTTYLTLNAASDRLCYAFCRKGVGLAVPEDVVTKTGPDSERGFNPKVYIETVVGASRLQETHVVQISCRES